MNNISNYDIELTANTSLPCAIQRAANIASLYLFNKKERRVLELCVGPSLPVLEACYKQHRITVFGNDIDKKYLKQSPNLIIGDCFSIDYNVVAVPLIDKVVKYYDIYLI